MLRIGLCVLLVGCAELASVERLRCGNGLHELQAGEDCDGLPPGSPLSCGTPGTTAACRFVCAADDPCPDGWTCGQDAICRVGQGRLDSPWTRVLDGPDLATGDLDGDGYDDVVVQSSTALHVGFGEVTGTLGELQTLRLPDPSTRPSVGDVDGDRYADLATYSRSGPIIYRGGPERRLLPVATPYAEPGGTPELAKGVRAHAPYTSEQLLAIWQTDQGLRAELGGHPLDTADVLLPDDPSQLGHVAVGDIGGDGDALALAVEGNDRVDIAGFECAPDGACALRRVQSIQVPMGARLLGGAFFGDIDGDGDLDLVAQVLQRGQTIVISRNEPGGFTAFEAPPGLRIVLQPGVMQRPEDGPVLQAVVDVVGDARADFATNTTLYAQVGGAGMAVEQVDRLVPGQPAQRVVPADLDGDGRTDLVVVESGALSLLTFDQADRFAVNVHPIGAIEEIAVGDFDGDGRDDVIARQAIDGTLFATRGDTIEPIAALDPGPSRLAALERNALDFGIVPATLQALIDGAAFAFEGQATGPPFTRMPLLGLGRFATIGRLIDGAPGAVFATRRGAEAGDLYPLIGSELGSSQPTPALDPCITPVRFASITRPVDFDGDGRDAVLELHTETIGAPSDGADPGPGWTVRSVEIVDGAAVCRFSGVADSALVPIDLDVLDLDGDGRDDIAALLVDPTVAAGQAVPSGESALAVWLATDDGHPTDARIVVLPDGAAAIAAMRLRGRPTLVLATADALLTSGWVDGELVFERLGDAPAGIQALARADVDGDGLDDLVIKTLGAVVIRRQPVCTARAAWEGQCVRDEP